MTGYRDEFTRGQADATWTAWRVIPWAVVLFLALGAISYVLFWPLNAAKVVEQEFAPDVMLQKYEWFKDASAALDGDWVGPVTLARLAQGEPA
jgi:hypothetical protein